MSSKTPEVRKKRVSKVRVQNTKYLQTFVRKAGASMRPMIGEIIQLYSDNEIAQLLTAENMIRKVMGQTVNLRGKSQKTYDEVFKKQGAIRTDTTKAAAAAKIGRAIRGNVTFGVTRRTAFKNQTVSVVVKALTVGSALSTDITAFVARSYLAARKEIPRNANFKIWASCRYDYQTEDGEVQHKLPVTMTKYTNKELPKFFKEFVERISCSYGTIILKTMIFEYHFVVIPSGAGCGTTSREVESVLNKKSVLQIKNDDQNCFWYAMSCLLNPQNKAIRDSRTVHQRRALAEALCKQCKMKWNQPVSLLSLEKIEDILNCNIYVFSLRDMPVLRSSINIWNTLVFKSVPRYPQKYYLLFDDVRGHFDCITNIVGFLACQRFCEHCLKAFTKIETYTKHVCGENTRKKKQPGTMLKELPHYLKKKHTLGSKEEMETCCQKPTTLDRISRPRYIIYDFETDTHTDIHRPNHVEIDVLKIDQAQGHRYEDCLRDSLAFTGYGCEAKFCDWLFTDRNEHSTVIAHNGAGYDNKFILQHCLMRGLTPDNFIRQGSRITYMRFKKFNIRFIDSVHFFLQPLRKLSDTYNIDTIKGHFPHMFNRPENQTYVGRIPDESMFGVKNMSPDEYESEFKPWYDKQKKRTDWNFKQELVKYCRADVELLSKTVLHFRNLFKTSLDTDPFRYTTLASLCMSVYLNKFLPDKTIVGNNARKKDSLVCREWLLHFNNPNIKREVPIWVQGVDDNSRLHDGKVGEKKLYYDRQRPFTVDGFDYKTNTIYQFQGCYWHGCRKCHPENQERYDRTMEQNNYFCLNGYNLCQVWECEWNEKKRSLPNKRKLEADAVQQNIVIRDALFGGRTEGFQSYHKCNENEKIFYFDVVSLYPTVNALDPYAIGFGAYRNITCDDILNDKFFGVVKCDVIPPSDLLIPVLPDNSGGKLLFHLNPMYNKTFASVELKLALQKGYKIKIHAAIEYRKYTGLMKDYVEFFLKLKIEKTNTTHQKNALR